MPRRVAIQTETGMLTGQRAPCSYTAEKAEALAHGVGRKRVGEDKTHGRVDQRRERTKHLRNALPLERVALPIAGSQAALASAGR